MTRRLPQMSHTVHSLALRNGWRNMIRTCSVWSVHQSSFQTPYLSGRQASSLLSKVWNRTVSGDSSHLSYWNCSSCDSLSYWRILSVSTAACSYSFLGFGPQSNVAMNHVLALNHLPSLLRISERMVDAIILFIGVPSSNFQY